MNEERSYAIAARLADGRILVAGGYAGGDANLDSAELFDPATGTWTVADSMSESRVQGFGAALPDGRVLAAGGGDDGGRTSGELYDPATGTWTPTARMSTWRAGPLDPVLLPNGDVLVSGGFNDDNTSALLFNPSTRAWLATNPMHSGRGDEQSAVALRDGRVLICGGRPTSCDLYDQTTGAFTATASPPQSSNDLVRLTSLPNGAVLLAAGGTNLDASTTSPTARGQLFDPVTGRWSVTASPIKAEKVVRSASLLPDGTVLVVESSTADAGGTPSAEIYTP